MIKDSNFRTTEECETKKTKTEEGMDDDEDNAPLHIVEEEEDEDMETEEERNKDVKGDSTWLQILICLLSCKFGFNLFN